MRSEGTVTAKKVDFELSNFDDDCIECESKVQSCDATPRVLAAYKGAPCKKNFKIELLQYWKACGCAIFLLCEPVVYHCLLL